MLLDHKHFDIVEDLARDGLYIPFDFMSADEQGYLYLVEYVYPKLYAHISKQVDGCNVLEEIRRRINALISERKAALDVWNLAHPGWTADYDEDEDDEVLASRPKAVTSYELERYLRGNAGPEDGDTCQYVYARGMHKGRACGAACYPKDKFCNMCMKKKVNWVGVTGLPTLRGKYMRA